MKKITSVLEFAPKVEEYTITNPESGEDFVIRLRPLTPGELSDLNSQIKRPKPKVTGFHPYKDEFGRPVPIYDEDSPEFVKEQAKANQDFVFSWLIASWEVEIPGETLEEKMDCLRKNIPNWVFVALQQKLQEVQGYRQSDVAYAKKKSKITEADILNTKSAGNGANG